MIEHLIHEALAYDPATGAITRRTDARNGRKAGDSATSASKGGYLTVSVQSRNLYAHRVAWLLTHGEWPANVDHINGDRADNRLANLRDVPQQINSQNRTKSTGASGLLGVYLDKRRGKVFASIMADGKGKFLGYHDTPEAAHAAYVRAKRELHEGCTL